MANMTNSFTTALDAAASETEDLLGALLSPQPAAGEIERPQRLLDAMRYSSLGGGKRLRPILTDALRMQTLCDNQEGIHSMPSLLMARAGGVRSEESTAL